VDFFDMGTALAAGNIDAFLSGEPFPSVAVAKGYGRILAYPYFDESIGTINGGMLVRRQTIEKEPEKVFQLVLSHARATRYLREQSGEWLKKATDFGVSVDVLETALPNMELAWEMDEAFVAKARALGERMLALGLIERLPDYDRLFDLSFVRRVQGELRLQEPGSR
jgi:NitT/TauT family transport system substrate-binding protein